MSENTTTKNELLVQTQHATVPAPILNNPAVDSFSSAAAFNETWKMANFLAKSQLIPQNYHGRPEDCVIAIDMSRRMGASPFMVLQNMYIVYGKPAWSSQFLIACLNSCGRFSPLRYRMIGEKGKDDYGCVAWTKDLKDGEILESPEMNIGIAKKEGWYGKNGSKWQTMPDLMLRYRAATLFARLYAPELTFGMKTEEEICDIQPIVTESRPSRFDKALEAPAPAASSEPKKAEPTDIEKLKKLIADKHIPVSAEDVKAYVESQGDMFIYDMVAPIINDIAEAILEGESKK